MIEGEALRKQPYHMMGCVLRGDRYLFEAQAHKGRQAAAAEELRREELTVDALIAVLAAFFRAREGFIFRGGFRHCEPATLFISVWVCNGYGVLGSDNYVGCLTALLAGVQGNLISSRYVEEELLILELVIW